MLRVIEQRELPFDELLLVASERSVGKEMTFKGKTYKVISMQDAVDQKPDVALFSAGGSTSITWAPKFAENGTIVIDNSSAWRMDPTKKLIVPEINGGVLRIDDRIIANPNCSTIQMVLAPRAAARALYHQAYRSVYLSVCDWHRKSRCRSNDE